MLTGLLLVCAGQVYHLDFYPPPANAPGLTERLVQPAGQEEEATKVRFSQLLSMCAILLQSERQQHDMSHSVAVSHLACRVVLTLVAFAGQCQLARKQYTATITTVRTLTVLCISDP
jgi:hypothetical protein